LPALGGALAGLRVLEVASLYAAPQIGAMLGDLGADVVKVEPPSGDPMRQMGTVHDGVSRSWSWVGRNKRSIVLDLVDESSQETFRRLVGAADVLIENLDAKTRARWRCSYAELSAVNPRIVVVSVSCYGLTGPYADRAGAGTLAEAFGGLAHMTGNPDGPPMLASVALGDTLTAFGGVIGALAACWGRDASPVRDGRGRLVDATMYDPILQVMGVTLNAYDPASGAEPPGRYGSRVHGGAPRNVYRTRDDQWVAVSGTTDAQVARVLAVTGNDTPETGERFATSSARIALADELDGLVADWILAHDRDPVMTAFIDARIPIAPVNDVRDLLNDPHLAARGDLDRILGGRAPALDEHRDEILRDWL
jgi:crotonobetainyl-CoA:carnitine CoA-transferase CaiB-like acyl-CoA transferase